ncbi:MAG: hypothetical protein L0Y44_15875 [Phycisphaerales bacterium]|nr:hypothetical protein [Phycisphaerales bacterium]MCI0632122.1 hypothetical protein [Phycisphaerales bacterium]
MRRFLYLLLAAAVSGVAPSPVPVEATDPDGSEDAIGLVESGSHGRRGSGGSALGSKVVVRPLKPNDTTVDDQGVIESLIVDRSTPQVAVISSVATASGVDEAGRAQLLSAALKDSTRRGDLKVTIDSPLALECLTKLCFENRFIYSRTIARDGRHRHEFLADLYSHAPAKTDGA